MRVLLSAYACEPGGGSETGKGWNIAMELARQGHEVVVLTCGSHHREAIRAYCAAHAVPETLSFLYHDVPYVDGPGYANAWHIRKHYYAWQMTARRTVKAAHRIAPFDVIHHVTWTVLRWPSFLGGIAPRFVLGPVGGGQGSPRALRDNMPEHGKKRELKRDIINAVARFDPLVLWSVASADEVLVTDEATRKSIPRRWRRKVSLVADIYAPRVSTPALDQDDRPLTPDLLFIARLEYWKGAQLALGAVARLLSRQPDTRLTIVGAGPEQTYLTELAATLGLSERVRFTGSVPFEKVPEIYAAHAILLFPSLHDSGPHVVGEALAHGLPVVCLDLGGPGLAVDDSCGCAVSTAGRSREEVEEALAAAVDRLISDPERVSSLRAGVRARARQFQIESRVQHMAGFYARSTPRAASLPAAIGTAMPS